MADDGVVDRMVETEHVSGLQLADVGEADGRRLQMDEEGDGDLGKVIRDRGGQTLGGVGVELALGDGLEGRERIGVSRRSPGSRCG